ncbi:zinc-dependent alcohol dehydrogenase family protein [Brevibacillus dissolubilis]|uniref:zinc-dependent alcohol dehydrogenase family protein n=1 Tax=Brevibacillus dissolubilis TaxID=1844116 RepID=UPI001117663A|nr:zinc-dependent alcohol dehydrogenase family protein [Brevibacillus dissolubilis]
MRAKCIRFHQFGRPQDVLQVEEKEIKPPGRGEVLVRMTTRPINPSDLIPITGAYAHRISLPTIPGYEGVGVVEAVGSLVSSELLGQRVLPLRGEGTWQEYVTTQADFAVPIPHSIDDDTAAQLYINPVTAWITCTDVLRLRAGDILLVNACGSAIGRIFAQLSRLIGFQLIAVTRSHQHTEELLALGASYVINTSETPLHATVMELTHGLGATAAIDSIGGEDGARLAFCVRPNGVLVTIGLLSGIPVNWAHVSQQTHVNVKLFHLRHWNQQVSVQTWQDTFQLLLSFLQKQALQFRGSAIKYDLVDVQQAVCAAEDSVNKGKIFLTS